MLSDVIGGIDRATATTLAIAFSGWVVLLLLQNKNIKDQHRVKILYDIYKQFVGLRQGVQDAVSKLGAMSSPPLVLMESSMISSKVGLKTERECLYDGELKWQDYCNEISNQFFLFQGAHRAFGAVSEDWTAALKPLVRTQVIFSSKINKLSDEIYKIIGNLRDVPQVKGRDWRQWDTKEIRGISEIISQKTMEIGSYYNDFMVLLHNHLVSGHFGKTRRPTRKTLDSSFVVLVKKGFVVNVDHVSVLCIKQLDKIHRRKILQSNDLVLCKECSVPVMVLTIKKQENDSFVFLYGCGHSWRHPLNKKEQIAAVICTSIMQWRNPYLR